MPGLATGTLDRIVRIERPVTDDSFDGAGSGSWAVVAANVWCSLSDMLPSRSEKVGSGINLSTRPTRVRMHFRDDITSDMRLVETTGGIDGRVMQIVAGPAEIGQRDGIELMVEEYSPAGGPA